MNKGIETLHNIFSNVTIGTNNEYSQILLKKCLDLIKEIVGSKDLIEEKKDIIVKCLLFFKLIIEESEKKGTARIKSHSALLKKKVVNLFVSSFISKADDFFIRVYGNTTIWELKEIISKRVKISHEFLKIVIKSNEISESDNGKTIIDFNVK